MSRLSTSVSAAAALAVFLWPSAVPAQPVCGPRDNFLDHLRGQYDEQPIGLGLTNGGGVIEVLTAPDGKTWTIIVTLPNGRSCVVAAGHAWERLTGDGVTGEGT